MDGDDQPQRFYMSDIEFELKRGRSTIRTWERMGWLPKELEFCRDVDGPWKGWRYWTPDQLEMAKQWMATRNQGRSQQRPTVA